MFQIISEFCDIQTALCWNSKPKGLWTDTSVILEQCLSSKKKNNKVRVSRICLGTALPSPTSLVLDLCDSARDACVVQTGADSSLSAVAALQNTAGTWCWEVDVVLGGGGLLPSCRGMCV